MPDLRHESELNYRWNKTFPHSKASDGKRHCSVSRDFPPVKRCLSVLSKHLHLPQPKLIGLCYEMIIEWIWSWGLLILATSVPWLRGCYISPHCFVEVGSQNWEEDYPSCVSLRWFHPPTVCRWSDVVSRHSINCIPPQSLRTAVKMRLWHACKFYMAFYSIMRQWSCHCFLVYWTRTWFLGMKSTSAVRFHRSWY